MSGFRPRDLELDGVLCNRMKGILCDVCERFGQS